MVRPGQRKGGQRRRTLATGTEFSVAGHRCLLIRRSAGAYLRRSFAHLPRSPRWTCSGLRPEHVHELAVLLDALPRQVIYVDLETCGLNNAPVFLTGLLRFDHQCNDWVVEQYFARTLDEEPALLHAFWRAADRAKAIGTFNGKSFDMKLLESRSQYHRLKRPRRTGRHGRGSSRGPVHCDVLHYARRLWKRKHDLPNCKLQTLEYCLCGRERDDDIPGRLIPAAYDTFVQTGETNDIERILEHNFLDLVTLADLSFRVLHEIAS